MRSFIDVVTTVVPPGAQILEIGSGPGIHAEYLEKLGFSVQRTEASSGLLNHLVSTGVAVVKLNILTDPIAGEFDLIFANAVIHHFEPVDLPRVLRKMHSALRNKGIAALSTKQGEGETWETEKLELPRYFRLMTAPELQANLLEAGFSSVETRAGIIGSTGQPWLTAIAHKL